MGLFVRRVKTSSGATAVQIMHKRGRRVLGVEHIGSAHDEAKLAALEEVARQRLHAGEQELPLEMPQNSRSGPSAGTYSPVVEDTASLLLWDALAGVYDRLGFAVLKDETFKALVLGRIIEPTSKVDTLRVLAEVGVWVPSISTVKRCLRRVIGATTATPSVLPATPMPPLVGCWGWCYTTSPLCISRPTRKTVCARSG